LRGAVALALTALITAPAFAQKATNSTTHTLRAEGDGYPISITYYPVNKDDKNATAMENAPVVILLHGEGGSRLIWDKSSAQRTASGKDLPFAEALNSLGYAVVTVDLRKHGESVADGQARSLDNNDFYKMARGDLPAVKKFLLAEHEAKKLNLNKLAIVASDSMAPVALEFAELDWRELPYLDGPGGTPGTPRGQDVKALVLVSPVLSVGKVNATRAANFLKTRPIAFAIVAGTRDPEDKGSADKINQIVSSIRKNQERIEFIRPDTNARGTDLFGSQARPEPPILKFLDKNVKDLKVPWQTRKSRYDRDTPAE